MNQKSFFQRFLRGNQKTLGILGLMFIIFLVTGLAKSSYWGEQNLMNMSRYIGLFGIIAIGVSFVIMTGGIDLSIGSLIGLTGVMFPMMLMTGQPFSDSPLPIPVAFAVILGLSAFIGLVHGLLITKLKLQPFLVTLCGLLIYRGFARNVASDNTQGFREKFVELKDSFAKGMLFDTVPMPLVIVILIGIAAAILLNLTTYGRYLLALGRNEEAARFSGINTDRTKIFAYVICSMLAGFGGIMFVLDTNAATPSKFGNFYELWAIAGAVLGGCSLRGGEGTISGVIGGAALVQITMTAVFFLGVKDSNKLSVIGFFILFGVILDEFLKRYAAKRRALAHALPASVEKSDPGG